MEELLEEGQSEQALGEEEKYYYDDDDADADDDNITPVRRGEFDPQLPSSPPGCQGRPLTKMKMTTMKTNDRIKHDRDDKTKLNANAAHL